MPRRSAGRLRRRSAAARLRVKVGHPDDSTGSATIHSHIIVMATASRGVKPYSGQPQGVIRDSLHAPGSTVAQPRHQSPLPSDKPAAQAPTDAALETQRTRRSKQHTPRYHIGTHHGQGLASPWAIERWRPRRACTCRLHYRLQTSGCVCVIAQSAAEILKLCDCSRSFRLLAHRRLLPARPCRPRSSEYVFFRDGARV